MRSTGTKVILAIVAVSMSTLAIAASAWSIGSGHDAAAMGYCCSSESCPMKKDVSSKEMATTDDKCACCKDGSCAMKKKNPSAKDAAMSCDKCACCKVNSCPMKKGEHREVTDMEMKHAEKQNGATKSCCSCCHKDMGGEKTIQAVIDLVSYEPN